MYPNLRETFFDRGANGIHLQFEVHPQKNTNRIADAEALVGYGFLEIDHLYKIRLSSTQINLLEALTGHLEFNLNELWCDPELKNKKSYVFIQKKRIRVTIQEIQGNEVCGTLQIISEPNYNNMIVSLYICIGGMIFKGQRSFVIHNDKCNGVYNLVNYHRRLPSSDVSFSYLMHVTLQVKVKQTLSDDAEYSKFRHAFIPDRLIEDFVTNCVIKRDVKNLKKYWFKPLNTLHQNRVLLHLFSSNLLHYFIPLDRIRLLLQQYVDLAPCLFTLPDHDVPSPGFMAHVLQNNEQVNTYHVSPTEAQPFVQSLIQLGWRTIINKLGLVHLLENLNFGTVNNTNNTNNNTYHNFHNNNLLNNLLDDNINHINIYVPNNVDQHHILDNNNLDNVADTDGGVFNHEVYLNDPQEPVLEPVLESELIGINFMNVLNHTPDELQALLIADPIFDQADVRNSKRKKADQSYLSQTSNRSADDKDSRL
eukprot:TRINITY_DN1170_c0_g1_i1.p1 TRINITY_DN1170_c0_g1~~TRINITY_DN1170_c0_g1_i1.p1  ORF type:complete len:479 (+),score=72.49 TRINITY_DN1170_c0_g1_i1:54-1490(+)